MSQLININTKFKHMDFIKSACEQLNWTIQEGGHVRYYYGAGPECDFTIEMSEDEGYWISQKYNLGLQLNEEKVYDVLCDNAMAGAVTASDRLGGSTLTVLNKFKRAYGEASVIALARSQRHRPEIIERQRSGRVHMRIYGDF